MKKLLSLPPNLVECFHDIEKADQTEIFGNYFAMTCRGDIHGYIISVLCAKSYKRDEYANGKINSYLQMCIRDRSLLKRLGIYNNK